MSRMQRRSISIWPAGIRVFIESASRNKWDSQLSRRLAGLISCEIIPFRRAISNLRFWLWAPLTMCLKARTSLKTIRACMMNTFPNQTNPRILQCHPVQAKRKRSKEVMVKLVQCPRKVKSRESRIRPRMLLILARQRLSAKMEKQPLPDPRPRTSSSQVMERWPKKNLLVRPRKSQSPERRNHQPKWLIHKRSRRKWSLRRVKRGRLIRRLRVM